MSQKNESIKRYTLEEIKKLREQGNTGTDWNYLQSLSQEEANKIALEDEPFLNDEKFWNNIEFADSSKKIVEIILDSEVASFYKKMADCQDTINSVLKAYMLVQEHRI